MNKAITEGLVLMPPPFSAGLDLWSREEGLIGQGSYQSQSNAAFVPSDQDFGGCLELTKTVSTMKLRCFQSIPFEPGLYLRVTAQVKAISGALPSVRIAGWAGNSSGNNVGSAQQIGPSVALTTYGEVVSVSAIIGSGNRQGVDMVWGLAPIYGHFGLDLTGATGGVVRIEDIVIEDASDVFLSTRFNWVDVWDYGAVGDGVTDDLASFNAADDVAAGKVVLVPQGNYKLSNSMTFDNPVQFEGTVTMAANDKLVLRRNFDLPSYTAAFGGELAGFRRALQALFFYTDHVELDLAGRRVEIDAPINVAALCGLSTFAERRAIRNGQLQAITSSAWNTDSVTSVATYSISQSTKLTAVANVANITVGARVSGTGVGREVYVTSCNVSAGTVQLSQPLWAAAGTRTFTFDRYKYMLDFSGFDALSKFEVTNVEMLCNGLCSTILLAPDGELFRLADSVVNRPRDRGITSTGRGCQDLQIDSCQFISNEVTMAAQDRTTIAFNVNANDTKIRLNRSSRFAHFGVLNGTGHIFLGNHFFGGDNETAGVRRAGIVFTLPNVKSFITGNYIYNCFIEMSNEQDATPDFSAEYTFGGLTITGNIFTAADVAPWFRWLVVTPRGPGHSLNGYIVVGNAFRVFSSSIERIEMVDTTYAPLAFNSFRNVVFENNTYNGVSQASLSPVLVQHSQNTEATTWSVDAADYMPFGSYARNVIAMVPEGAVTNVSGAAQYVMPYSQAEQGGSHNLINLKWPSAVKGVMQVTIRCDNPL
ncbi:MAG: glycosyl hydrolase family 28-related protein [bacterium]